jgi:hypothetical protein
MRQVKVGELVRYMQGDLMATRSMLSQFVLNGNGYLPQEEGEKFVDMLTVEELYSTAAKLFRGMEEEAVPLPSARE